MPVNTPVETYEDGVLVSTGIISTPDDVVNAQTLREQATASFIANRAFVALAAPTNAQTVAQVKALSRQLNGTLRLVLQQFDGVD